MVGQVGHACFKKLKVRINEMLLKIGYTAHVDMTCDRCSHMSMHGSAGDAVMHARACIMCAACAVCADACRSCIGQQHCAVQRVRACIETIYDVHKVQK